jgi:hypothetical protein
VRFLPEAGKGHRKLIVSLIALGMSFILAMPFIGVLDGGQWVTVTGLIITVFTGGNGVEHHLENVAAKNEDEAGK